MPRQSNLLVHRLDRNEAHVALTGGGGDRLGVVAIVLGSAALAKRRDELGSHQPRLQAIVLAATPPMVRAAARLHRHGRAGRDVRQPLLEGLSRSRRSLTRPAASTEHTANTGCAKSTPMVIVRMGSSSSRFTDGENHHGPSRPSGYPQGWGASFLLVQAEAASFPVTWPVKLGMWLAPPRVSA